MSIPRCWCFLAAALIALPSVSSAEEAAPLLPSYKFTPVEDGAVLSLSLGLGLLSEAIIKTGEIQPQRPISPDVLLAIDRPFATSAAATDGRFFSDAGIALAFGWAFTDSLLCFFVDRGDSAWTYAGIYGQAIAINLAVANLTKIAVRRPRPRSYYNFLQTGVVSTVTDDALSFYSLHTAFTAGVAATAAHFAFTRDPDGWMGWVFVGAGVLVTTFVGIQRVRDRAHFPTDVVAGAMIGAGIGVLVPAIHRTIPEKPIALSPLGFGEAGGGGLAISGVF